MEIFVLHGRHRSDAQGAGDRGNTTTPYSAVKFTTLPHRTLLAVPLHQVGVADVGKRVKRDIARALRLQAVGSGGRVERGASSTAPYESKLLVALAPRIAAQHQLRYLDGAAELTYSWKSDGA
jgi:hypothetical protein